MTNTLRDAHIFTAVLWNRLCAECANDEGWSHAREDGVGLRNGTGVFQAIRFAMLDADETCFGLVPMMRDPHAIYTATSQYRAAFDAALLKYPDEMYPDEMYPDEMYFAQVEVTRRLIEIVRAEIIEHFGPDV